MSNTAEKKSVDYMSPDREDISCCIVETLFGELVDDDISVSMRKVVEEHIKGCPKCSRAFDEYRSVISIAKELKEYPPMPEDAKRRLRKRLSEELGIPFRDLE